MNIVTRNWRDLIRPRGIQLETETLTEFYGKFTCEPLERGYGITLGNSLRRILLSSLQGAAITAVKIEGALHEFTTIGDVVEDVTDIILNLKEVVLKAAQAKTYTVRIDKEGPGPVYARDIQLVDGLQVLNPDHLVATLGDFDRVSVGFPGVVVDGVTKSAPNLHPRWTGFPLAKKLELAWRKPVRVANDAGVQGLGVIEGRGVEMVITLGTGMGCALFLDGRYVPNLELAHHPFHKGKTYEEYVGAKALAKVGKKKWNQHVAKVLAQIEPIWNPREIYLGGGNAKHLTITLPPNVKVTANVAGLLGGIALWGDPPVARASKS